MIRLREVRDGAERVGRMPAPTRVVHERARERDQVRLPFLEDALCLVFLEHQLADLAAKTTEDKMINAIQKTWQKMTPAGRDAALKLRYGPVEKALLEKALPIA